MIKITLNISEIVNSQFTMSEIDNIIPATRLLYENGLIPKLYYEGLIKLSLNLKDEDKELKTVLSKLDEIYKDKIL